MGYDNRKTLWFDIEDGWRGWIECPLQGADASPEGWGTDGTLLNGGGYALNSFGSNKVFQFEWPSSSSRQDAQLMKSFSDGTYGRGLIHFILPTLYDTNILTAAWADPSIAVDDEGRSMVYGLDPEGVPTSGWQTNMLPTQSAYYNLIAIDEGYRGDLDSLYLPIPDGYTLVLGAFYSATGTGGIWARPVNENGTQGSDVLLTPLANNSDVVVVDQFSGGRGVRIWLGKTEFGPSSVTVTALIARLIKTSDVIIPEVIDPESLGYGEDGYGETPYGGILSPEQFSPKFLELQRGPWIGGMGSNGCRFVGKPTFVNNTGLNGGTVSYAATFREVLL